MPLHAIAAWLERVNTHPVMKWLVVAFVALPVVLSLVVTVEYTRQGHCVARYNDQFAARAERLTKVNADTARITGAYITALTTVLNDAIRRDQAALRRDLPKYESAARDYQVQSGMAKAALARNPLPPAPKFQCRW
jgi:hypothetical protein